MKIWNLLEQIRGKWLMAKVGFQHAAECSSSKRTPWGSLVFRIQHRRRHVTSHRSSSFTLLQSLAIEDSRDKPTYSVLLGQLFAFIGTNPDQAVRPVLPTTHKWHWKAQEACDSWQESSVPPSLAFQVSSSSFLLAAQTRWRRGNTRKQALVHMRELLTAAVRVGGVTHLVGPVTMVLQGGPRSVVSVQCELTCRHGQKPCQSLRLGPNHRQWYLLMLSPKTLYFYFYKSSSWFCKRFSVYNCK